MKINIFGVGRSGTTAIVLYFSYWLAKLEKEIWVNNEPFHWHSRKGPISMEGQDLFFKSGFVMDEKEVLNKRLKNFVNNLTHNRKHVTTKFVAGSGFYKQINQVTQPDHTVIVIRNIYDVLKSVSGSEWDFLTIYSPIISGHKDGWKHFRAAVEKKNLLKNHDFTLADIKTKEEHNALYWYLINLKLLESADDTVHILPFEKMEELIIPLTSSILKIEESELLPIKIPLFYDKNLGGDYPLTQENRLLRNNKYKNLVNELIFMFNNNLKMNIPFLPFKTGSKATLSTDESSLIKHTTSKKNPPVQLEDDSIIHKFQKDIESKINQHKNTFRSA